MKVLEFEGQGSGFQGIRVYRLQGIRAKVLRFGGEGGGGGSGLIAAFVYQSVFRVKGSWGVWHVTPEPWASKLRIHQRGHPHAKIC